MLKTSKIIIRILILILPILILLQSCEPQPYEPEGLKKLNREEKIERSTKTLPPNNYVIKNQKGEIISEDSINNIINIEKYTTDIYVNEKNEVVELILREANEEDLEIRKIINKNLQEVWEENKGYYEADINCDEIELQLAEIVKSDQEMRKEGSDIDINQDVKNISEVTSMLNNCPSEVSKLSSEGKFSIWLIIQHAPSKYRKKYISMFEKWAKNGEINKTSVAMMKDRILMDDSEPQIYGTQVKLNRETNKYELYDLANPETVNARRAEIGFMPIEEYLARWDIEFKVEQNK